jgi:hypothetical protein
VAHFFPGKMTVTRLDFWARVMVLSFFFLSSSVVWLSVADKVAPASSATLESDLETLEAGTPTFAWEVFPDAETDWAIRLAVMVSPLTLALPPLMTVPLTVPAAEMLTPPPHEHPG